MKNWKSLLLLVLAIPIVNFVAREVGRSSAERANLRDAESFAPQPTDAGRIRLVVSSQSAEGITQDQLDISFLKYLEEYTVERVKLRAKEYLASVGQPNTDLDITSESTYVVADERKLAVIRLMASGARQVFVAGIVGDELRRVGCIGESSENIPISYGICGDKVEEVFGVRVGG